MKVLIIRFSSIGDIVLTTPVIRCLKEQGKDVEIHFCTKKSYQNLVSENPYISKTHILPNSLSTLIKELKLEKFDYIIDLHNNFRTRIIKFRLGVKAYTFDKLNIKKTLLTSFKINKMPNTHIVDRYMKTIENLGIKNDDKGLDYYIPHKDIVEIDWLPESHRQNFIAFAIGGQHTTKRLPCNKLIEVCERINRPIVLLGGKEDVEMAEKIIHFFNPTLEKEERRLHNQLNKNTIVYNGCGRFNLNQSASIAKQSSAVFTHDTGMMHIAAAFQKEIFSIWGNTVPEFGMYPYQTKFTIFENKSLSCRPCSKIGYDKCPKGHFKCMNDIKFNFLFDYE